MFDWIAQNLGTLLISAVLIAIVTSIIISLIRQKKRGKSSFEKRRDNGITLPSW